MFTFLSEIYRFSVACQYKIDYCTDSTDIITMKFYEFLALTTKYDELIDYLCAKNVIRKKIKCPRCQNIAELNSGQLLFHCTQHYYKQIQGRKRKRLICNFKLSALNGTWFSQAVLNIDTACRLICYVLMINTPRQAFLQKELHISAHTAVDWINFFREVIYLNTFNIIFNYNNLSF